MQEIVFIRKETVTVLTDQPVNGGLLDYIVSADSVSTGQYVEIPFGRRSCIGVIWGEGSKKLNYSKLKPIKRTLEIPLMSSELKNFLVEFARYTLNPLNKVFKLSLGALDFKRFPKGKRYFKSGDLTRYQSSPKRKKVLEFFLKFPNKFFLMEELTIPLGVSSSLINNLVKVGCIVQVYRHEFSPYDTLPSVYSKTLSIKQNLASVKLRGLVRKKKYNTTLLFGVTGSGKTEVYLDAISQALAMGRQVLVLVPEITLSIDFVKRVINRYGIEPGIWHSGIQRKERFRLFDAVTKNKVQLVIGARSALFLPFAELGLIIVDEEHDGSFKQEETVCYNARDMAVLRGSMTGAQVVLASATPSLETWVNADIGKYGRIDLNERYGGAVLPEIEVLNLSEQHMPKGRFISPYLKDEMERRISKGQQALLFLNRRGYAPVTICVACGFQIGCKVCDARLVQHRFKNVLMCHQCGDTIAIPYICPKCKTEGKLKAVGPGVEKIAEECQALFPKARVGILSSDSIDSYIELQEKFSQLASGEIDIIIGTQLVSKGHNFKNITLVGVIDADLGLQGGDLRAAEKTFQSLRQVSGRAGRYKRSGSAIIQTYTPSHPVIKAISAGSDEAFWALEAQLRRKAGVPPFGKMIAFVISGSNEKLLFEIGRMMVDRWVNFIHTESIIFGPALAPIGKIKKKFRVRLLIKCKKSEVIQPKIKELLSNISIPRSVKVLVDVDPQNFF